MTPLIVVMAVDPVTGEPVKEGFVAISSFEYLEARVKELTGQTTEPGKWRVGEERRKFVDESLAAGLKIVCKPVIF